MPALVVDPEDGGSKGGTDGVFWHGVVVEITGFAVGGDVLAEQGVLAFDRRDAAQNFDLRTRM